MQNSNATVWFLVMACLGAAQLAIAAGEIRKCIARHLRRVLATRAYDSRTRKVLPHSYLAGDRAIKNYPTELVMFAILLDNCTFVTRNHTASIGAPIVLTGATRVRTVRCGWRTIVTRQLHARTRTHVGHIRSVIPAPRLFTLAAVVRAMLCVQTTLTKLAHTQFGKQRNDCRRTQTYISIFTMRTECAVRRAP